MKFLSKYGSTKTPIISEWKILSLNQLDIVVEKTFYNILLSYHAFRIVN